MSSDGSFPLFILAAAIIIMAIVNGFAVAARRSLDHLDRNAIKESLEEDCDNKRLTRILNFLDKPSGYHTELGSPGEERTGTPLSA